MGFNAGLVVLKPHRFAAVKATRSRRGILQNPEAKKVSAVQRHYTLWRADETISFGYITRFAKLTEKEYAHIHHSQKERAGICAFSYLFKKLCELFEKPCKRNFAPRFVLIGPKDDRALWTWQEQGASYGRLRGGEEYVVLFEKPELWMNYQTDMREVHNARIALPTRRFRHFIRKEYHPIRGAPFVWSEATTVGEWLSEMESAGSREWQELAEEPWAVAQVRAWRAFISEIAALDARILFVFPDFGGSDTTL